MSTPPQVVRVQVTLNPSADTADQIMNTWHCVAIATATPLDAATAFTGDLKTFYSNIDNYFSPALSGENALYRCFDLDEPMPRQPILETTGASFVTGTNYTLRELAVCVSYKGTYVSGTSPKRKRGRIYLGPFSANALDSTTGRLAGAMVTAIQGVADTLITASKADADYRWVVYSPTSDPNAHNQGGGAGNDAGCWDAVTEGWVDNEPDIQRRRGLSGGVRSTFS